MSTDLVVWHVCIMFEHSRPLICLKPVKGYLPQRANVGVFYYFNLASISITFVFIYAMLCK